MSEKEEIIFMQTRLVRLASKEWHLPVDEILTSSEKQMYLAISKNVMGFFTAKEMMLY